MNREEFLNSLENRLQVLNKQERDDILSEYRQHIELRIGSGLSEEAAIQDFGNLDDLAAEILDAYNVDPEYGRKRHIRLFGGEGKKNHFSSTVKEEAGRGKRIFQIIGEKVSGAVKRCLTCLKQWAHACCSGFVRKKKGSEETLPADSGTGWGKKQKKKAGVSVDEEYKERNPVVYQGSRNRISVAAYGGHGSCRSGLPGHFSGSYRSRLSGGGLYGWNVWRSSRVYRSVSAGSGYSVWPWGKRRK